MKKLLLTLALASLLAACKDEQTAMSPETAPETAPIAATSAKEGHGSITLQCGTQTLTVDGKCGGVTNTGEMIIAVQDKTVPSKVFTISFNTADYPKAGKTYTARKSDYMSEGRKPETDVYIGFSEMTSKSQMDWSSDDASGKLQFEVDGNEIRCSFRDLKLQPSPVYNKGELNSVGTASGEITLYKN